VDSVCARQDPEPTVTPLMAFRLIHVGGGVVGNPISTPESVLAEMRAWAATPTRASRRGTCSGIAGILDCYLDARDVRRYRAATEVRGG